MDISQVFSTFGSGPQTNFQHDQTGGGAMPVAPKAPGASITNVPGQLLSMGGQALSGIVTGTINSAHQIGTDLLSSAKTYGESNSQNSQRDILMAQMKGYRQAYQSGRIDKGAYQAKLADINSKLQGMTENIKSIEAPIDKQNFGSEAKDVANVTGAVLTLAGGAVAKGAQLTAEDLASMSAGKALAAKAAAGLEDGIGVGKTFGTNPVTQVGGKLVRNALVTQPTIQQSFQLGGDLKDQHYSQAAIDAGLLIGVPLAAGKVIPAVGKAVGGAIEKTFGKPSFLDSIPTKDGVKISDFLNSPAATKADQKTARIMQQYNLNQSGGDVNKATQFYKQWLGSDAAEMTAQQHLHDFQKMVDEVNQYRKMAMTGEILKPDGTMFTKADIANLWVGRFSTADRSALANQLDTAGTAAERVQAIKDMASPDNADAPAWAQNKHLVNQLTDAAASDNYRAEIAKLNPTVDLRDIPHGMTDSFAVEGKPSDGAAKFDAAVNAPADATLPKNLSGAKPNYSYGQNRFMLKFGNDTTKALYIVGGKGASASHEDYMNFLRQATGKTDAEINQMAQQVRDGIKAEAKTSDNSIINVANHPGSEPVPTAPKPTATTTSEPAAESTPLTTPKQGNNKYVPIMRSAGEDIPSLRNSGPVVAGVEGTKLGDAITKYGMSPQATPEGAVSTAVKNNLVQSFANSDSPYLKGRGVDIYKALTAKVDDTKFAYDPRQLSEGAILDALGSKATPADAAEVAKALRDAYANVPSALTGAGNKFLNKTIQHVPLMATYLKVQGIAKFSANPFFYLKRLSKSEIISVLEGADHVGMTPQTEQTMRAAGYWSKYIQDAGQADLFGNTIGQAGKNQLSGPIKNIVGGMAESMAKARGFDSVQAMLDDPSSGPELDHAVRTALGYPKGGYLNSPLAKTLNILIFPSRFETKVAMAVGHAFAKQPAMVQAAIVTNVANFTTYLNSPEGKQWQKDNSETIQLLKYFTPLSTIQNVSNFLHSGKVGDLGEIGGLPFGLIIQLLSHQGAPIGPLGSSEYHDPKSGDVVTTPIPNDAKGRVQTLVSDTIQSMFSWPGRQAGLISKSKLVQDAVPALKQNASDYTTPPSATDKAAADASANANTDATVQPIVPRTPAATPTAVRLTAPAGTGTTKKAKVVPKSEQIIRP